MHRKLWTNDPDCVLLRDHEIELSRNERELYALACGALDNMMIDSDNLSLVGEEGKSLFRRSLDLRGGKSRVLGVLGDDLYLIESKGGPAGDFTLGVNLSDEPAEIRGNTVTARSGALTKS
jgi:alpha-galactosidase